MTGRCSTPRPLGRSRTALGILDHRLSRMMTTFYAELSRDSLPVPAACLEPLVQMRRRWRHYAHRGLVPRNWNHDLARMQMQAGIAEAGAISVDIVADDLPAHRGCVNPQLMGTARNRLQRQPANTVAAPQHFPVGDRRLPVRIGLLPPAALDVEAA